MAEKPIQEEKRVFMTGNEVVAWAAVAAGADIMYGYPITPQNEIMHYWTRLAPKHGKKFLQTEDELSAGFTTLGGALAGRKSFSATAGPGTTLFQEPLSMAEMMRIPVVVIVQQRGGPSTATVIYSQQEVNMVTFGGNGEGWRVVYSTATHQELFDYTIKAFNTAWKYRFPTFILGDGYQAKMREPLVMYNPEDRGIEMIKPVASLGLPGTPGKDRDAVHLRNTYSVEEELYNAAMLIQEDYEKMSKEVVEWDEKNIDDADIVIISHGVVSRAAIAAMNRLREKGIKVGYFRPITLRPFPDEQLQKVAAKCSNFLLVESALGQLARLVKGALFNMPIDKFDTIYKPGVGFTAEELVQRIENTIK
jgi:2-oxoglutarate ferredoxin oxidoreductase subunit alpha